jgi:hypothetical protein
MTEEQTLKFKEQQREFPQTLEILRRVRDALAAKTFETPLNARDVREDLYTRVQALDALTGEMQQILRDGGDEKAIAAYVEALANKPATTG